MTGDNDNMKDDETNSMLYARFLPRLATAELDGRMDASAARAALTFSDVEEQDSQFDHDAENSVANSTATSTPADIAFPPMS